jgi:fumarylacetoacetate (FAA) hydrolase family protein
MLFLGTMFAPTDDRNEPAQGFTHLVGEETMIRSERLGAPVNRVDHAERIAPWTLGPARSCATSRGAVFCAPEGRHDWA